DKQQVLLHHLAYFCLKQVVPFDLGIKGTPHVRGGDDGILAVPRDIGSLAAQVGEVEEASRDLAATSGQAHAVLEDRSNGRAVEGKKLFVVGKLSQAPAVLAEDLITPFHFLVE